MSEIDFNWNDDSATVVENRQVSDVVYIKGKSCPMSIIPLPHKPHVVFQIFENGKSRIAQMGEKGASRKLYFYGVGMDGQAHIYSCGVKVWEGIVGVMKTVTKMVNGS